MSTALRKSKRKQMVKSFTSPQRGLSKQQAADYCGCESLAAFDQWRAKGIVCGPIPGTTKWDRKAIDLSLDRASNLVTESAELSPYQRWKIANASKTETADA
jgi:hypothetical protein